jgi:dUTP pyrophosphatase
MKLNFKKLHPNAVAPSYATEGDAGLDLSALEATVIPAGERKLVKTGIAVELLPGTVGLVCSRSGLAYKKGVFVLNAPGIIDSGYRNDVGVILQNAGDEDFVIEAGDRIAQLVIQEFISVKLVEVEELGESDRGQGGFGSTGFRVAPLVTVPAP